MTASNPDNPDPKASRHDPVRIMLVDDSAVIRGLMYRMIDKEPGLEVTATAGNGQNALNAMDKAQPEIIVLDIEMPVMDGITALPKILEKQPDAKVIICSTLSTANAEITLKALSLGATECIAKPTSTRDISGNAEGFQEEFIRLLNGLARSLNRRKRSAPEHRESRAPASAKSRPAQEEIRYELKQDGFFRGIPEALAISSSTGGPQALMTLFESFRDRKLPCPVFITQHMPATFTSILAKRLGQHCGLPAHEAEDGMTIENGHIYVARGGVHMGLKRGTGGTSLRLVDTQPENYCKPSADVMLRDILSFYRHKVISVVLTGMGSDGLKGCRELGSAGARIIAQDKESSVVWGMPRAVALEGLCSDVRPLQEIAPLVLRQMTGG